MCRRLNRCTARPLCSPRQLNFFSRAYGTGAAQTFGSSPVFYSDVSPLITLLQGAVTPSTVGGERLRLTVAYMVPTYNYSAVVLVGGRNCQVIDPATGLNVSATGVAAMLLAQYPTLQTYYDIVCVVPAGEGANVTVVVRRDNSTSAAQTISYAPPTLVDVTVMDPNLGVAAVTSLPSAVQLLPTQGGAMTLSGANFGLHPTVTITTADAVTCVTFTTAVAGCSLSPTPMSAAGVLTFPLPSGTGAVGTIVLNVGGQAAAAVPLAYKAPQVFHVSTLHGASTLGGDVAIVVGRYFGVTGLDPVVTLLRSDGAVFACDRGSTTGPPACATPIVYRTDTQLQFVLPEGSGSGLSVNITVAGQSGVLTGAFSYDPPVVDGVVVMADDGTVTSWSSPQNQQQQQQQQAVGSGTNVGSGSSSSGSVMTVPASGGVAVVVTGRNFGFGADPHCVFLSWIAASPAVPPTCDGHETFVGEGEVPVGSLTGLNHTTVSFVAPPGIGTVTLGLLAYNVLALQLVTLQYTPPHVTLTSQTVFGTDGGVLFTLSGSNFGPATTRRPLPFFLPTALPLTPDTRPVTAFLVVRFGYKCMVTPPSVQGQTLPAGLSSCDAASIASRDDGAVTLVSPSGVGVKVTVTVCVVEPDGYQSSTLRVLNDTSGVVVSFAPPALQFVSPAVLGMDARTSSYLLDFRVANIGLDVDLTDPRTPVALQAVSILIDGRPCDDARRSTVASALSGTSYPVLSCGLQNRTVGYQNITITAAGQTSATVPADPSANTLLVSGTTAFVFFRK